MANGNQGYTKEEFAGLIRKKHPDKYNHYSDNSLTDKILSDYPQYQSWVKKPEKAYKEYDPDLGDHLNKAWYNFKSMGVEIPSAAIGIATKLLNEDSEVRESMLGFSEGLRGWAKKKQNEWIESDSGIQGYLEWQKDKPMSLKNFWHFDMMLRGVSDLAPSIATMMMGAGGVNLGLKAIGAGTKLLKYGTQAGSMVSMGALEGSGEYNEAMAYLVDEKGMKPNEAVNTAANAAIAVGIGNGMLEYYGINRLAKLSGIGGKKIKKMYTTKMVDKLTDNRFLNKTGDVLTNAVVEGLTEATQSVNQELVQNVYKKYGGDIDLAFDNFVEDFKHSAFSPETKESYFSALSGTLLIGGVGASSSQFSRRMLDNFKDNQVNKDIYDDTSGLPQPSGQVSRSPQGINLSHITYGDESITNEEGPALLVVKEDAGIEGNQLKNRIEASIDYVVENGQAAFDDNNVDRVDFIEQIIKSKEDVDIDSGKIDKLTEVVNQIKQVEINEAAERIAAERQLRQFETGVEGQIEIDEIEAVEQDIAQELTLEEMSKEAKAKQELSPDEVKYNEIQSEIRDIDRQLKEDKEIDDEIKKKYPDFERDAKRNIEKRNLKERKSILQEQASVMEAVSDERKAEETYEADPTITTAEDVIVHSGAAKGADIAFQEAAEAEGVIPKVEYKSEADVTDKEVKKIVVQSKITKQGQFDFQPIAKTDKAKIKENKQVAKKIVSKLKKKFPFIQANAVEKVFNEEGQEVAGRAFKNVVEWSTTQGTLDTIPHEYAHIYMKIMSGHPVIQEGLERFGGEENLVQYIGDYYAGKIQDKGLISRLKTWLRKWTNALKNFFGVVMTDKEVADLISEKFYSFKMKEADLGTLVKSKSIAYQRAETSEKVDKKIDLDGAEIEHYKNDLKDFSFDSIDKSVEWKQVTYRSGAKQPRLTNYYGDPGTDYTYSRVVNKPKKWSKELLALKKEVERITGFRFNSALVNKYRTGSDAIGWHADNEPELGDTPIIASVSFGTTRVFKLQKVNPATGKRYGEVKTFPLADSDLFLMFGNTQKNYHHSISKEVEKGARINITFRNTTHDLLQNRAFEKPKASRQEKAVIQSKFNNMMDDIFSKVRRFAKTNNEEVNIPTFVHTAIKGFETDRKNWIPLFYKWMGQHKNEELNDIALIGSTADGESSSLFSIEDPDIDEITLYKTSSLVDSVKDNDIAISEAEIDARQNIKRAVDRSLTLLGLKITETERTNLYDAAKTKDFDEWYRDDLANLLAFKKKDIKELTHGQNDAAAQLHTFLQNRISINRKAGGGNAINYIRFDKRWNKPQRRWQYSIKLIGPQERTYANDYGVGIIKEQSQYDTNLIAHSKPHLSTLLRGMYFLTDGMFNQIETIKDKLEGIDPYKNLLGKKSYKFLNAAEIRALENTGISFNYFTDKVDTKTGEVSTTSKKGSLQDKMVFLFSRGDSGKIAIGSINGRHLNIARSQEKWEDFWNAAEKGGYINKDQLKSYLSMTIRGVGFKFEDIAIRSRAIATFDYINSFIPGWLSRDFADVLKRIKVPLTPAFSNKRVPDAEAMFIPVGRIQFSVGDGPKHNGMEKIGSLGETYEGDGNTITSKRYVKSVAKAYGIDRAIGWLKSVVYDIDPYMDDKGNIIPLSDVNMLMLKHQHSIPEVGLKIWNNNTLVGEVNRDGNIEASDGTIVDMIMTGDEAKMREGKYVDKDDLQGIKTVEFEIPGSAFGLVKMSVDKKNTVKFPLQWMNYIQDQDLIADLVEAFTGSNSKSQQILRILMKATRDPKQIKVLADTLKSKFKEEVDTGLHNDIMASGGLIPRDAGRLEIIARGKILDPAINLAEQAGAPLYFAPNYARDLKVNELAVDINAIIKNKQLRDRFKKDNPDKDLTFENINSWLDKNDIRVLAYRSPIAYAGGVNYLRIKRLTPTNGTVQIHRNTTFLGYQGDYDGDALYILTMPDKMNEKLKDFFESKVFTDKIKGVNLEKLKGKVGKFNPMHPSDRSQMIEAMVYSNTAIQEIASTSLLFGLIRNSVVSANINGEIIVPNTGIIDMGNGVKGDADYVLRVYLEAAVDNPKYLLLKDWKYNVTDLRKKLFKTKAGLTLDKFDVADERGWIKNDEWKGFNDAVWKTYGIAANIRNLNDNKGKKDTVEGIINNSKNYAAFISRRLNSTKPHRDIPGVEVTFNNNVSLLERSVAGVYEMFDKYVDSGPKGADSRKSPLRFDAKTYEAAHVEAKSTMNIGSRLEVLRNKMGQTKFNAAQTFARGILKDAIKAMTTKETKNRRPLQPNSWEVNEDLINLRIFKLEKLLESSKEGQETVTLTMIKEIGNRDLDLLPPHEYLHSAVNQYYKVNNDYLRGEPTVEEISDVGLDEARRRNCGQGL